jgi:hypothetical protein
VIDEAWSTAAFEFWKVSLPAEEQKAYSNILSKCDQFQAFEDLSEVLWRIGVDSCEVCSCIRLGIRATSTRS